MKPLCLLLIAFGCTLFISACGKCSGCDEIITLDGAEIKMPDSLDVRYTRQLNIHVERIGTRSKGDRKCFYKNLVECVVDDLYLPNISLSCDKELVLNTGYVAANQNLFSINSLLDTVNYSGYDYVPDLYLIPDTLFTKGSYTFILSGKTKNNKDISDTALLLFY